MIWECKQKGLLQQVNFDIHYSLIHSTILYVTVWFLRGRAQLKIKILDDLFEHCQISPHIIFKMHNYFSVLVSPDSLVATALSRFFWHWAAIYTCTKQTFSVFRHYKDKTESQEEDQRWIISVISTPCTCKWHCSDHCLNKLLEMKMNGGRLGPFLAPFLQPFPSTDSCLLKQSNYWKQFILSLTHTWEHRYLAYFWSPTWCCPSNGKILKNLEKLHDSKLLEVYITVF